ncbi:MAG: CoA-binding protein [Crocinitomicaceae bacterium]
MSQKVLVLGASLKAERYSNLAINMLLDYGHEVIAVGLKVGDIRGVQIQKEMPTEAHLDTVTLYLSPENQTPYYDSIIALKPQRVIFNPGTENPVFMEKLKSAGINVEVACTLVLLRTNQFEVISA